MHWPQILIVAGQGLSVCGYCVKSGRENRAAPALVALFDAAVRLSILYFGGFFAVWGWSP